MEKCDFCSSQPVEWEVVARDFTLGDIVGSKGNWAACAECARLLREGDWRGLTLRSIQRFAIVRGRPMNEMEQQAVRQLHMLLRENMTGEMLPWP